MNHSQTNEGLEMKKKLVILFLPIAISLLSGCKIDREQSFKEMWNLVSIGNTKDSAVAMLGKPSSIESIEVPIISTEKIDWNVDGNTYTLQFI